MNFILKFLVSALIILGLSKILPGIQVKSFSSAILIAIVITILNKFIRPILDFISFPINLITLGLFSFVITALIILLAGKILGERFHVDGFIYALLFGVVYSFIGAYLNKN